MTDPASPAEPARASTLPAPPSVHVRALITWIAIFPLVAVGLTVMAPLAEGWHPILRALVLTVIIVPLAVYLVVPQLLRLYQGSRARRNRR
jgi:antibiotic biosynthesis monooxygenase (ABM) superfamily enzyme